MGFQPTILDFTESRLNLNILQVDFKNEKSGYVYVMFTEHQSMIKFLDTILKVYVLSSTALQLCPGLPGLFLLLLSLINAYLFKINSNIFLLFTPKLS